MTDFVPLHLCLGHILDQLVQTRSTLRNSRVRSYLTEGHWLHCMWCTLVDSLVSNLRSGGVKVVWRMQDLAQRLICEWMDDEVIKMFR